MNKFKKIAAVLLCFVLLASLLISCNSGKDNKESTAGTTQPNDSTEEPKAEQMDFSKLDVSKYITLGNYTGLTLEVSKIEITEQDIQNEINAILEKKATYEKLTDTEQVIADGDMININFKGFMNGEQFQGGTASDVTVTMKNGNVEGYIDGFGAPIIGAHVGDTVIAEVVFPEDYHQKDFASKPATFEITINYKCGEKVLPEFNDAFIKDYTSGSYTTTEKYLEDLKKSLDNELENLKLAAAWNKIIENSTYTEIPQQQVDYLYSYFREEIEYYAAMVGMTYNTFLSSGYAYTYLGIGAFSDSDVKEIATEYVKEELAYFAIIQAEGLKATDKDVEAYVKLAVETSGGTVTEEQIYTEYTKDEIIDMIVKNVLGHNFVIENNTFTEKKTEDK